MTHSIMKYLYLFLAFFVFSSSLAQNKQTKNASYYEYKTECLEDKLDGSFIFMAWGAGSSKSEAIDQAKRNIINDILFNGVNITNCHITPLILEVQADVKYKSYVAKFFKDDYKNYLSVEKSPKSKKMEKATLTMS